MKAAKKPHGAIRPGTPADEAIVAFDDNSLASQLFGRYDQNLAILERTLGVVSGAPPVDGIDATLALVP